MDRRAVRLSKEFQGMLSLVGPYGLFDFHCADLSQQEAAEFLRRELSHETIANTHYLDPHEYQRRYPDTPPQKYLIRYSCTGLLEPEGDEEPKTSDRHAMMVVFGYDFPAKAPIIIWYTPIWHPNFSRPYVCTQGRPFAAGVPLARIVLMIGEMIQYRNYNLESPLNDAAKQWAEQNKHLFPVDNRDLVDSRYRYKTQPAAMSLKIEPLVELIGEAAGGPDVEDQLVKFID